MRPLDVILGHLSDLLPMLCEVVGCPCRGVVCPWDWFGFRGIGIICKNKETVGVKWFAFGDKSIRGRGYLGSVQITVSQGFTSQRVVNPPHQTFKE